MIIYTRGDRIPPEKRDRRFIHNGNPSAAALKKYWRLLPDGSPDPDCKPYRGRWEIDLHHQADQSLGAYQIDADPPGRKRSITVDRVEYQRQYYQNRKAAKKLSSE
jgi:hypothetical protein